MALSVVYSLASVMPELPEKHVKLLNMSMPSIPIFPMDLFSRGTDLRWDTLKHTTSQSYAQTYPEILDLKVNDASGEQDVIGVTNWHEQPVHEKLGLSASSYVVFDYWMSTHITQEFC